MATKNQIQLLEACREGYHKSTPTNPYLYSSDSFAAYAVGEHMAALELSTPVACWAGQGTKINVHTAANKWVATVHYLKVGAVRVTMER